MCTKHQIWGDVCERDVEPSGAGAGSVAGSVSSERTTGGASLSPPGAPSPARWWRTACPVVSRTEWI